MTNGLLHPLRTPRRRGRAHDRRGLDQGRTRAHRPEPPAPPAPVVDEAVERVRCAGGPIDHAAYNCECGYCFSAAVSTTVSCPHCGTGQAW
ncbi:MAG TPA: hypothetical protein VHT27_10025 [Solirubrobacteraceae bacterium]|jgi:hypothetical protein|nr:hypothetical protein [Solirubrobacteraceae bacterium]